MNVAKLFKPWTWCKPEPAPDSDKEMASETKRYEEALSGLKAATRELEARRARSQSLDELESRVQTTDELMRHALGRRRLPSGSG